METKQIGKRRLKDMLFALAFLLMLFHDAAMVYRNKVLQQELDECRQKVQGEALNPHLEGSGPQAPKVQ